MNKIIGTKRGPRLLSGIYTRDSQAYQFRMPAGFAGDVNRYHPFSVEPATPDVANPPTYYGQAGVIDATSHLFRTVLAGDGALTDIYGIVVRPFPFQQATTTNYGAATIGSAAVGTVDKLSIARNGYIMVNVNNFAAAQPAKGGTVYVWIAATIANHVQGSFEAQATGGSTIALPTPRCSFNGSTDTNGVTEVELHV